MDWPTPDLLAVYDPPRAPAIAPENPAAWAEVPAAELNERRRRLAEHQRSLAENGVYLFGYSATGQLRYYALDQQHAQLLLRERFGEAAQLRYLGATLRVLRPHPFGSWLAQARMLHLFYALPQNGEQPGGCVVHENEERVLAAVSIVDWLGAKTLRGGFTASHITVTLDRELGDRPVIDNFENTTRPHWTTAAKVSLPRPQDL